MQPNLKITGETPEVHSDRRKSREDTEEIKDIPKISQSYPQDIPTSYQSYPQDVIERIIWIESMDWVKLQKVATGH